MKIAIIFGTALELHFKWIRFIMISGSLGNQNYFHYNWHHNFHCKDQAGIEAKPTYLALKQSRVALSNSPIFLCSVSYLQPSSLILAMQCKKYMKFIRDFSISWCLLCWIFPDLYDMGCTKSPQPSGLLFHPCWAGCSCWLVSPPLCWCPMPGDVLHRQEECAFDAKWTNKRWLMDAVRCTCFVFCFAFNHHRY